MPITINIFYKGKNGNVKKFANEMILNGIVDEIRKEKGNLGYDYFIPLNDDETILLIDKWQDQDSLDKHHQSKLMLEIAKLRDKYDLTMEVKRYIEIQSNPKDEKYIKK